MTIEQYYGLPEDAPRIEIIEGIVYDMSPAPIAKHQVAVAVLHHRIYRHVRGRKVGRVFLSPIDTELDRRTIVQPDVVFFRWGRPAKWQPRAPFREPPDFVAEVLSPGTAVKDTTIKRDKYEQAGVGEYWILDPETEQVVVYRLREGRFESTTSEGTTVASSVIDDFTLDLDDFWREVSEGLPEVS